MTARRVLVVLHEETLGGASISVLRCVPELERRGWEFAFFVPSPSPLHDALVERGHEVRGAPRPLAYSLRALRLEPGPRARLAAVPNYLREFRRAIRELEPAVLHANSRVTITEALIGRLSGLPTVLHVHEMVGTGLKHGAFRYAASAVATEVVAVSDACADRLSHGRFRPRVVHGGVPTIEKPVTIRDRPLAVGTVGAISKRKGSDIFVEAARRVRAEAPELEFTLVGSSTSEPLDVDWGAAVLRRAADAGVRHLESADVLALLGEWDIFALPSRRDPFPIAMLEAMGAGLPVVGADADGIPEQIGDAGVVVEADDPGALAEAILRLARAPMPERSRLGAAARARIRREFTIEGQAAGLEAAYLAAAPKLAATA